MLGSSKEDAMRRNECIIKLLFFISSLSIGSQLVFCSKPFPKGDEYLLLSVLQSGLGANSPTSFKYIFVTSGTSNGNLGGVSGADTICSAAKATDGASLPGTSTEYRALIVGTGRTAGGTGWPLHASTTYYKNYPNPTLVFSTTSGALPSLPLNQALPGSAIHIWTGISSTWTTGTTCLNWTDNTVGNTGEYGVSGATDITSFNNLLADTCDTLNHLLCVRL